MREWLVSLLFVIGLLSAVLLLASSVHQWISGDSHLFGIFQNHYLFILPALLLLAVSPRVRYGPMFDLWNVIIPKVIDKPWKWTIGLFHWRFRPDPPEVKQLVALRS
ncbi:MAG: hypothetical protein COV79_02370, partial [Parcubacteria group bacterium CG11_big_fil_rev_8_21_14_0_20_41_14]